MFNWVLNTPSGKHSSTFVNSNFIKFKYHTNVFHWLGNFVLTPAVLTSSLYFCKKDFTKSWLFPLLFYWGHLVVLFSFTWWFPRVLRSTFSRYYSDVVWCKVFKVKQLITKTVDFNILIKQFTAALWIDRS